MANSPALAASARSVVTEPLFEARVELIKCIEGGGGRQHAGKLSLVRLLRNPFIMSTYPHKAGRWVWYQNNAVLS